MLSDDVSASIARMSQLAGASGIDLCDVLEETNQRLRRRMELLLTPGSPWFEAEPPTMDRYWIYLETVTGHEWSYESVAERFALLRAPSDTREAIGPALRYEVLSRDRSTCKRCGRQAPQVEVHVDHILPWSLGGPTTPENLQVLCAECNLGKSNRFVEGV
jgi:hypothetical protein